MMSHVPPDVVSQRREHLLSKTEHWFFGGALRPSEKGLDPTVRLELRDKKIRLAESSKDLDYFDVARETLSLLLPLGPAARLSCNSFDQVGKVVHVLFRELGVDDVDVLNVAAENFQRGDDFYLLLLGQALPRTGSNVGEGKLVEDVGLGTTHGIEKGDGLSFDREVVLFSIVRRDEDLTTLSHVDQSLLPSLWSSLVSYTLVLS